MTFRAFRRSRFYQQYGLWGTAIIIASIVSIVLGIFISIKFYWTVSPFLKAATPNDKLDLNATSMVGDFIGGVVGPILSFVGVLLFFLALRLQSKELGLQIKEMQGTRNVFLTQQFENTFFNLLQTQQDIRLNIQIEVEDTIETDPPDYSSYAPMPININNTYKSGAFFDFVREEMFKYNKRLNELTLKNNLISSTPIIEPGERTHKLKAIKNLLMNEFRINDINIILDDEKKAKVVYKQAYIKYANNLSHYFRNLYHILLYLKENERRELDFVQNQPVDASWDEPERMKGILRHSNGEIMQVRSKYRKYAAFIQAQMSGSELFLLFYNGLFFPKMKKLIYHFDFLENLNLDDLLNPEAEKNLYQECVIDGHKYQAVSLKQREEQLKI